MAEAAPCEMTDADAGVVSDDSTADGVVDGKTSDAVDQNWDCLLACDGFMATSFEGSEVDVTTFDVSTVDASEGDPVPMRFMLFKPEIIDEAVIADDSVPVEKSGLDEFEYTDETFVDQEFVTDENPPTEDWDPSWAYRSVVTFDGEVTEEDLGEDVTVTSDDSGVVVDDSEVKITIYHSLNPDATDDNSVIEELVAIDDQPPVDGWDPSWLYRSLAGSPEGSLDDEVNIDDIMLEEQIPVDQLGEDGLGCGVSPEGFVPGESIDSDGDGLPEDFVMYPFDPIPVDQLGEDGLGCGISPEGFVPGESVDSDGDGFPDDFVMYPYDPIPVDQLGEDGLDCGVSPEGFVPEETVDFDGDGIPDDFVTDPIYSDGSFDPQIMMTFGGGVENVKDSGIDVADGETKEVIDFDDSVIEEELYLYPVDEVVEFGDEEFLVSDGDDSSVPQIRFLSASGDSEVQRTLSDSSVSAIELAVAASAPQAGTTEATTSAVIPSLQSSITTNVVPVRQATSNSLFSASRDKSTIGVALSSPSSSGTVNSPPGTKSTSTPKRAKSLLQSNLNSSDETSGLNNLSPLIEDEADSPEVDAAPGPQDLQADERIAAEPTVSRNEDVDSSSNTAVKNTRQSGKIRAGMIDEVMSHYSENSYNA